MRLDLGRWREFGLGLALGLSLSLFVLVWQNYREQEAAKVAAQPPKPEPRAAKAKDSDETANTFEFYERLANIEVKVPEKAQPSGNDRDTVPGSVDRPGVYVIQAGSFRRQEDADRVQAQLRVLGIDSSVLKVQIEQGETFRVRIGPLSDLVEINRLRARLSAADFESAPFRVGD